MSNPPASTLEGLIERAEHVAETWERGRYGDKTLRLRAELTAQTLRDLLAILAASASAPAARPHFRCSEGCGVVAVDEDGCCRTCGADAVASAPAVPRETTKEEKADMSPGSTT
jgi:hypothetical protein